MNQEVLYRYSPHAEVKEVQLVVPTHERENILKLHHDAPTAAHFGADGTFPEFPRNITGLPVVTNLTNLLGVYHTSALTPFLNGTETQSPVVPLKKKRKATQTAIDSRGTAGENAIMSQYTPHRDGFRPCRGRM
ncbi:uncharacterized protein TNCV_278901 [Trichonephila clavipes]|nr:uncharacterized protein TNCV_278901 [Trichonephila clavipes]